MGPPMGPSSRRASLLQLALHGEGGLNGPQRAYDALTPLLPHPCLLTERCKRAALSRLPRWQAGPQAIALQPGQDAALEHADAAQQTRRTERCWPPGRPSAACTCTEAEHCDPRCYSGDLQQNKRHNSQAGTIWQAPPLLHLSAGVEGEDKHLALCRPSCVQTWRSPT